MIESTIAVLFAVVAIASWIVGFTSGRAYQSRATLAAFDKKFGPGNLLRKLHD